MDRAGTRGGVDGAARAARWLYGRRVVLVCGKGNNGGDGLVARAVLRAGACARACSSSRPGSIVAACTRALADADVVVDAMYGTGFRGTLDGDAAWVVEQLDEFGR